LLGQGYAIAPQQAARTRRHGLAPDGAARDRSAERLHGARAYSIRRTTARTGGPSWMPCAMRAIVGYSPNCSSRAWPPGGEEAHGHCHAAGDSLHSVVLPRTLHTLIRCATPEARTAGSLGACSVPHAGRRGGVSGGQPGRDTPL